MREGGPRLTQSAWEVETEREHLFDTIRRDEESGAP